MVINHNISSLNTLNKLNANTSAAQSSLEKLSSGLRINKAGDDAAGLAISQKMQAQINGLDQASRNSQDGISLVQTAEGAMNQIQTIMQRMNTIANESANGTNDGTSGTDRTALQSEFSALSDEISRISNATSFNGTKLIQGDLTSTALTLQVGANQSETIDIKIANMDTKATTNANTTITALASASIASQASAQAALSTIQKGIDEVSASRASLGTYQNRLQYTINNLSTESQNLQSASSQITDVDMAAEMTNFTKNSILTQAAQAMLAQANQLPQGVLSLLK